MFHVHISIQPQLFPKRERFMNYPMISEGVYGSKDAVITASRKEVEFLVRQAGVLPRKRARLCTHHHPDNTVHEMLIAMARETYIMPHAHEDKTESFHVIHGRAALVIFDARGNITRLLELGDLASGMTFYFRIAEPFYHTVLIDSEFLVIHETTTGPFKPNSARLAPWAPPESDRDAVVSYMNELRRRVEKLRASGCGGES